MPVSKMYLFYVQEHGDVPQFVVEASEGFREPASEATTFLYADPKLLAKELTVDKEREKADWLELWQQMNETVHTHLFTEAEANITEGEAVRAVREAIPENSAFFVGNSMPIRDVDTFFTNTNKSVHILANRGVNGIDGRSEEHTSELQSRGHLVCRLLLEKKKNINIQTHVSVDNNNTSSE